MRPIPEVAAEQALTLVKPLLQTDWSMLHRQKYELIELLAYAESEGYSKGAVEGLVYLIDALQDAAEEVGLWEFQMPKKTKKREYPECEKLAKVAPESNKIGRFID